MSTVSAEPTEEIMLAAHDALEAAREHLRGESGATDLYDQVNAALHAVRGRPAQPPTDDTLKTLLHHQRAVGSQVMTYLLDPYGRDRLVLCDKVHRADAELRKALHGGGYLRHPWPEGGFTAVMVQDRRALIVKMRKQADGLRSLFMSEAADLMEQAAREMQYDLLAWAPAQ